MFSCSESSNERCHGRPATPSGGHEREGGRVAVGGANIARVREGERKDETEERGRENMRRKRKGS